MAALDHARQKALELKNSLQIIANNTAGTNQLGTTPRATYKAGPDGLPIPVVTDDSTKGTAGTGTESKETFLQLEFPLDTVRRLQELQIAEAPSRIRGAKPANAILKTPNIDSRYIDLQIKNNFKPLEIPKQGVELFPIA